MKKKVLILVTHYLPGYKAGGPIRSISNLVEWLGEEFEFYIITSDTDRNSVIPYENILEHEWNNVGKAKVLYTRKANITRKFLLSVITKIKPDLIYLNSLFDFYFSIKPLLYISNLSTKLPVLLAPRGELYIGALNYKSLKKKIFLNVSKYMGVYKNIIWHASNEQEYKSIQYQIGSGSIIFRAENLPPRINLTDINNFESNIYGYKKDNKLRLVYISRITAKKNLLGAIEILSKIKCSYSFDIYGPIADEEYWKKCKNIIKELNLHDTINYKGTIMHSDVIHVFSSYDLFLFPTFGENFGHVILESLLGGCPVLTSTETPWKELNINKAGWCISLKDTCHIAEIIDDYSQISIEEKKIMKINALKIAKKKLNNWDVINDNRIMFKNMLDMTS